MNSLTLTIGFQSFLTKQQSIPVLGTFVVSPIKAVSGIVEVVLGLSLFIFSTLLSVVIPNKFFFNLSALSVFHMMNGAVETRIGVKNLFSFGSVNRNYQNIPA